MRKPHNVNVNLDSDIDLKDLSREISLGLESVVREVSIYVTSAYILMKGFKTLCSAFEHVVVTKVR
jgi:hypothetical protein